jgi:hypothetical protein
MQAALDSLDGETSPAATMAREKYAAARKVAEDHNEPQAATGLASRCTPPAVRPARRSCPRINSRNAVTQRDGAASDPNLSPLDFLLKLMWQRDLPVEYRVSVAHQALPFAQAGA